MVILDA
ncbi:hypothetical protein ECEC96038_0831, partial [Escherichia coli EC96038]